MQTNRSTTVRWIQAFGSEPRSCFPWSQGIVSEQNFSRSALFHFNNDQKPSQSSYQFQLFFFKFQCEHRKSSFMAKKPWTPVKKIKIFTRVTFQFVGNQVQFCQTLAFLGRDTRQKNEWRRGGQDSKWDQV